MSPHGCHNNKIATESTQPSRLATDHSRLGNRLWHNGVRDPKQSRVPRTARPPLTARSDFTRCDKHSQAPTPTLAGRRDSVFDRLSSHLEPVNSKVSRIDGTFSKIGGFGELISLHSKPEEGVLLDFRIYKVLALLRSRFFLEKITLKRHNLSLT